MHCGWFIVKYKKIEKNKKWLVLQNKKKPRAIKKMSTKTYKPSSEKNNLMISSTEA